MKKFLLFILSLLYLVIASGMVISIHYCMGKPRGIDYHYSASNQCTQCGMKNKKGCCHDEFRYIKLADDQQIAQKSFPAIESPECALTSYKIDLSGSIQGSSISEFWPYHSPPDRRASSLYQFNCIYRI